MLGALRQDPSHAVVRRQRLVPGDVHARPDDVFGVAPVAPLTPARGTFGRAQLPVPRVHWRQQRAHDPGRERPREVVPERFLEHTRALVRVQAVQQVEDRLRQRVVVVVADDVLELAVDAHEQADKVTGDAVVDGGQERVAVVAGVEEGERRPPERVGDDVLRQAAREMRLPCRPEVVVVEQQRGRARLERLLNGRPVGQRARPDGDVARHRPPRDRRRRTTRPAMVLRGRQRQRRRQERRHHIGGDFVRCAPVRLGRAVVVIADRRHHRGQIDRSGTLRSHAPAQTDRSRRRTLHVPGRGAEHHHCATIAADTAVAVAVSSLS